jgi:hypothetical protein
MEALRKSIMKEKPKTGKTRKAKEKGKSKDTADTDTAPHDSKK